MESTWNTYIEATHRLGFTAVTIINRANYETLASTTSNHIATAWEDPKTNKFINENQELLDVWDKTKQSFCFYGKRFNIVLHDEDDHIFIIAIKGNEVCVAREFKSIWFVAYGITKKKGSKASANTSQPHTIGLTVGGAKDINNFRKRIEKHLMPIIDSITYNGIMSEYYFDTNMKRDSNEDIDKDEKENENNARLFYPTYSYAKTKALRMNNAQKQDDYEYYMSVGLNSDITFDEFKRKKLNLVIVLDRSGSMGCSFETEHISQLEVANKAVVALLKHLKETDYFGFIEFDHEAVIKQKLQCIKDVNMDVLKQMILKTEPNGGTDFEKAYHVAISLFDNIETNNNEYENRIIMLTDAQPNIGKRDPKSLLSMVSKYAENKGLRVYTTFIGVGLDFNARLIERISQTRGCNYYSVKSSDAFMKRMDEEFSFMVTPLVFNVSLELKCEGDSCCIDKVYGGNKNNNAEIIKIHILFPSKRSAETGEAKGGIQLIKLKKLNGAEDKFNVILEVQYEDRNGKCFKNEELVTFSSNVMNDMIQYDIIENGDDYGEFDNTGIRKGILLCKYVELLKEWIQVENRNYYLNVSDAFKKRFKTFVSHFKSEQQKCNDSGLDKEIQLLQLLMNYELPKHLQMRKLNAQNSYVCVGGFSSAPDAFNKISNGIWDYLEESGV